VKKYNPPPSPPSTIRTLNKKPTPPSPGKLNTRYKKLQKGKKKQNPCHPPPLRRSKM